MKYEYTILQQNLDDALKAKMNELGASGWKCISFVQIDHSLVCIVVFEREVQAISDGKPFVNHDLKRAKKA